MIVPRSSREFVRVATALVVAGLLAGCTSTKSGSQVGHYSVRVPQTAMYRYGPAQSFGADFNLTQGQHVVMLGKDFGYSRVMTDDGQSGYVATEDLVPAAPPVVEKPKPAGGLFARAPLPSGWRGRSAPSSANNQILRGAPLFGEGEGDLDPLPPLPDNDPLQGSPTKKPASGNKSSSGGKPGFRVNVPVPSSGSSTSSKPETKAEGKTEGKPGFRVNVPTR